MPYCSRCLIDYPEAEGVEAICRVCGGTLSGGAKDQAGAEAGGARPGGNERLVELRDYPDLSEALVVQAMLRSLGLHCIVKGGIAEKKIVRMILGYPVSPSRHPFVGFQIWVLEADLEKCREILDARAVDEIPPCSD